MAGIPHTALIYTDQRDRNKLISSCVNQANASWSPLLVLSAQPHSDTRCFRNKMKRSATLRGRPSPVVVDVSDMANSRNPLSDVQSGLKEALGDFPEGSTPLVIADWTHQVYDRFSICLEDEEEMERMLEKMTLNLVCCYRAEGFWSLDTKGIARLFELHRRVLFGSTVMEMSLHSGPRH
jgi:hypothetical protein